MIKKDLQCPCCGLPWEVFSEQAACIALFGECIVCRFSPSGKGSRAGNTDELERIIAKAKDARAKPAPTMKMLHTYSDLAGDGGMDPRNNFDAQPGQEPVASMEVKTSKAQISYSYSPEHGGFALPDGTYKLYTSPPQRQPDDNGITVDLLERFKATLTRLGYATPEGGLEQFGARLPTQLYNLCRAADSLLEEALVTKNVSLPEQEPVATISITQRGSSRTIDNHFADCVKDWPDGEYQLYTSPPQREWAGLTDEEIEDAWAGVSDPSRDEIDMNDFARAIEAKLKEKNT